METNTPTRKRVLFRVRILSVALATTSSFWGCAGFPAGPSQTSSGGYSKAGEPRSASPAPLESGMRSFEAPTEIDRLLDAKPHALPAIKPAALPTLEVSLPRAKKEPLASEASGAGTFRIQLDALADVDAAQARKAKLEGILGTRIDMVFDPPYYKLRFGNFSSKREAEDKILELAGKNLQGFIVRQ